MTEENVQSLLPAANLLSLSWVRDSCCRFLQSQLYPSNCLGIRSFGNFHHLNNGQYISVYQLQGFLCQKFLNQ